MSTPGQRKEPGPVGTEERASGGGRREALFTPFCSLLVSCHRSTTTEAEPEPQRDLLFGVPDSTPKWVISSAPRTGACEPPTKCASPQPRSSRGYRGGKRDAPYKGLGHQGHVCGPQHLREEVERPQISPAGVGRSPNTTESKLYIVGGASSTRGFNQPSRGWSQGPRTA